MLITEGLVLNLEKKHVLVLKVFFKKLKKISILDKFTLSSSYYAVKERGSDLNFYLKKEKYTSSPCIIWKKTCIRLSMCLIGLH